jgi:glutamyl-tRNA synthetase
MAPHLETLADALVDLTPFDAAGIEQVVRATAGDRGIKPGAFMQAVRVSLTGRTVSPGLFETIELLGAEDALARIRAGARQSQPA